MSRLTAGTDADRAQYRRHFRSERGSIAAERDQNQAEVALMNSRCSVANDVACGENRFKVDQAVMLHEYIQDKDRTHRDDFAE